MNNQDKAVEVIRTWQERHKNVMDSDPDWAAQNLAGDLHQAGLITPDLPESHREVALHTPEWFLDGPISLVVSDPSEGVVSYGSDVHNGAFRLVLTKEEAEGIALALLAAANHAEEA